MMTENVSPKARTPNVKDHPTHPHHSKQPNNLSPLLLGHKSISSTPSEKALSMDVTAAPKSAMCLPKLELHTQHTPRKEHKDHKDYKDSKDHHHKDNHNHHLHHDHQTPHHKPDQKGALTPLGNVSNKDKHASSPNNKLEYPLPAVAPGHSPTKMQVPPLDDVISAAKLSKHSPEKIDKAHHHPPGSQLHPHLCVSDHLTQSDTLLSPPSLCPLGDLHVQPQHSTTAGHKAHKHNNGSVSLHYESYCEKFSIKDGSITEAHINETFALSEVMPNCRLRLSTLTPSEMRDAVINVADGKRSTALIYLPENPDGTFNTLQNNHSYHVYVSQDSTQLRKEQAEREKHKVKSGGGGGGKNHTERVVRDDGRGFDSCTCIYGTPCVDEYGCRDWSKRFEVAKANGGSGLPSLGR